MSKKIQHTLITASAMIAIPFLSLTSCDSGEVDNGGASTFDLGTRFDEAELTANPDAVVEMPRFLLAGDAFRHDVPFVFPVQTVEYGRAFQASDPPIIVNQGGQISTSEGLAVAENVNYIYRPDGAFTLTEQNAQGPGGEGDVRLNFELEIQAIEDDVFSAGSLGELFNVGGNVRSAASAEIFEAAVESTGLVGSNQGALDPSLFSGFYSLFGTLDGASGIRETTITSATVRLDRTIVYQPTSTNADLMENGIISGNVTINDTLTNVVVLDGFDERGRITSLMSRNEIVNILNVVIGYNGIDSTVVSHTGTFTLDLTGGDTF